MERLSDSPNIRGPRNKLWVRFSSPLPAVPDYSLSLYGEFMHHGFQLYCKLLRRRVLNAESLSESEAQEATGGVGAVIKATCSCETAKQSKTLPSDQSHPASGPRLQVLEPNSPESLGWGCPGSFLPTLFSEGFTVQVSRETQ